MDFPFDLVTAEEYERQQMVHGGICALVLDHPLGEAASDCLTNPLFTGERTEGIKTYARGYLGNAGGWSLEADGVFMQPAWAREVG